MRSIEITENELAEVMRSRLNEVLDNEGSGHHGAILVCGMKPGLNYAYKRMSAREHVKAARLLLTHAETILKKKEIQADDIHAEIEAARQKLFVILKNFPSERDAEKKVPCDLTGERGPQGQTGPT